MRHHRDLDEAMRARRARRRIPVVRAVALLVCLQGLAWAAVGTAQEASNPALVTIKGAIVDVVTGEPLPGVLIAVGGAGMRLESDDAGRFTITPIAIGVYTLELSHPGYQTSMFQFTVLGNGEFVTSMDPVDHRSDGLMTGIRGEVRDELDGSPVVGATVWTAGARKWTQTDRRGRFSFTEMHPGIHLVQFSHLGYQTRADSIRVEYERLTNVRVPLSVDPVRLNPIEVSVERRDIALQDAGFYERKAMGFGRFLDREDIEKRAFGRMSDLFTGLPGVIMVQDTGNGQRYVMLSGGQGRLRNCFPRVVLDGMLVGGGADQPAQIDMLLSRDAVAGLEVYQRSAGVPAQYSGLGSTCGVIVIWSKR